MTPSTANVRAGGLRGSMAAAVVCLLTVMAQAEDARAPAGVPELGFRKEPHPAHEYLTFVWAAFPDVPGLTCDAWCYESNVRFLDFRKLEDGRVELRHRDGNLAHVVYVTTVTPEPGAVEFVARAVVDPQEDPDGKLPDRLPGLNLCFQLRRAKGFSSKPDPYPEFVRRCFIFTDQGQKFLLDTHRRQILHRFPADDPKNNPPWVQMYVGVWMPVPGVQGRGWAEYSTDRYTIPVVGTVSRDGKHLVALANGSADSLSNAWHDCLHNNPKWTPADAPPAEQRWRLKVYVMPNDPDALLARVAHDFPEATRLKERRVAPE
jgi:hypothetical protein